jgi:hypothetical protein
LNAVRCGEDGVEAYRRDVVVVLIRDFALASGEEFGIGQRTSLSCFTQQETMEKEKESIVEEED